MTSACCAGVSLGRSNVISSGSSIQPAMFDLELEWTVRVGGERRARSNLNSPTPLLIFYRRLQLCVSSFKILRNTRICI